MSIPKEDLPQVRFHLLRYAMRQLRDPAVAEDVVQETLLAAFNDGSRFAGRSSYKTWLIGILKHKILDAMRKRLREQSRAIVEECSEPGAVGDSFALDGHWRQIPSDWGDPEKSLEDKKFWEACESCLDSMPARAARVFVMREMMELSSDEICREMAITPSNLWVMLHRARLSLRECLEARWFGKVAG